MEALVTNQIDVEEGTDIVSGKGNGLFILLHGCVSNYLVLGSKVTSIVALVQVKHLQLRGKTGQNSDPGNNYAYRKQCSGGRTTAIIQGYMR